MDKQYHIITHDEALLSLSSSKEGLSQQEAEIRLEKYGKNELEAAKKPSLLKRLLLQLANPMIIVLIGAGIISGFFSEFVDMGIIFGIVLLNAAMGIFQESKAEKAIEALKKMSSPSAKALRGGRRVILDAGDLVPGDIVELEAGDTVPADMRLIEENGLRCEESSLTGESVPVEKDPAPIAKTDAVLGDRVNMAYFGSSVVYGRGSGVVTATGMSTEMGKIAKAITSTEESKTPIQRRMEELSKTLSLLVLVICAVIVAIGFFRFGHEQLFHSFLMAVSLAVAAIPEGLPTALTIIMALGVSVMARHSAIIRKLPAVETLGCTEIICSDKTGTLTQNRMTVKELYCGGSFSAAEGPAPEGDELRLIECLAYCNDSSESSAEDGSQRLLGDPTETALITLAQSRGYERRETLKSSPRVFSLPFDSDRKLMSTFHRSKDGILQYTKGAPDILLSKCDRALIRGDIVPLDEKVMQGIREANASMGSRALRVLAAAYETRAGVPAEGDVSCENGMIFLGLVGMIDPARPEVRDAVRLCRAAGIRPVMITGDHRDTAVAIAADLGIISDGGLAITGAELDKIPQDIFDRDVSKYSVYARVSPEHKVRIVSAWQKQGKIVAMTGDGVNDAPSLKAADIGIGMGITGTDVTKNVADMVLADDNFATIVVAVREGRMIYSNIRKAVQFLLSSNLAEVLSVLVATIMGFEILHTIHILFINLISDTFPALALGLEPAEKDIMEQRPRKADEGIFAGGLGISVAVQGAYIALATLAAYFIGARHSAETGVTMAFSTLIIVQMLHALNVRSRDKSIFTIGFFKNPKLLLASLGSIALTVIMVCVPPIASFFSLTPLSGMLWLYSVLISLSIIPFVELMKLIRRALSRRKAK